MSHRSSIRVLLGSRSSLVLVTSLALGAAACGGGGGGNTGGGGAATTTGTSTATGSSASSTTGTGTSTSSTTGNTGGGGGAMEGALVTGPNYILSYAAGDGIGIDGREPVTATFDASSQLIGYVWELNPSTMENERPLLGTNVVSDSGHTADIGWGRWNGGKMDGNFFGGTPSFSSTQGYHYVIAPKPGVATTATGSADYELIGATPPTSADGATPPGSFTGTVHLTFGDPPGIALKLEPTLGGVTYTIQTTGFPAASSEVNAGPLEFGGMVPTTGAGTCGGSCNSFVRGFYAADGAVVGVAYQVGTTTNRISGVAAFVKK